MEFGYCLGFGVQGYKCRECKGSRDVILNDGEPDGDRMEDDVETGFLGMYTGGFMELSK